MGSGVHTIAPTSALPAITGPVTIDGYTQPGSSANTNPTSLGLNTVLQVEIDCSSAGATGCLRVNADDVTIRGLAGQSQPGLRHRGDRSGRHSPEPRVEGYFLGPTPTAPRRSGPGAVIILKHNNARFGGATPAARNLLVGGPAGNTIIFSGNPGATDSVVAGNLVGTDVTGKVLLSGAAGVNIQFGSNIMIGGTSAAARNVIGLGVRVGAGSSGLDATGNFVQGNFVGTDVTGTVRFRCHDSCIEIADGDNTVGGSAAGAGNRVGGSDGAGIRVQAKADGTVIQGNFIGTDETGTAILPSATYGIHVYQTSGGVTIGGINAGEGNVVSNSLIAGIGVEGAAATATIRGNSIFDNPGSNVSTGLGIDLLSAGPGVTFNDADDADTGPNGLQNYPILSGVTYGASTTTVAGALDSAAATICDVDFYADPVCARRPQDLAEGKTYIGTAQITTDGSGHAVLNTVLPIAVPNGSPITATATDPAGNTSEFSPRFALSVTPRSGTSPSAVTVKGLAFEDGATATVGGLPAQSVTVVDAHTLTMSTPQALPPGSISAVTVQNPGGGLSGTIPNGWIVNFNDVPSSNLFYVQVIKLVASGITAGVGNGLYGVNQDTKRQQMAVFLLKSKYGVCYVPPPCNGDFADVACPSTFANWIEALADEGITGGCGSGNFCPTNAVRRDQMAAFLLKAKHGSSYVPPACSGDFNDVTCPSLFADWIEQLAAEGITGGCGNGNYCPLNNATRGQMAAFLVNTFSLP